MDSKISRRAFLGAAVSAPLVAGGMAGCATIPAFMNWLAPLATGIAAGIIGNYATLGVSETIEWVEAITTQLPEITPYWISEMYAQPGAPVVLVGLLETEDADPATDRLGAFVNGGTEAIVFPPWAWHTVSLLTTEKLAGLSEGQAADIRVLLGAGLAPSSTRLVEGGSPQGTAEFLTYESVLGPVEIVKVGAETTITVFGLPDESGAVLQRKYNPDDYRFQSA